MSTGNKTFFLWTFTAIFLLIISCNTYVYAENNYFEGPYTTQKEDSVFVANDNGFLVNTYTFNKGQTVYVRAVTKRIKHSVTASVIKLLNYEGAEVASAHLTQKTTQEPYIFEGTIQIPADAGSYLQLSVFIEWGKDAGHARGQLSAVQSLEIRDTEGTMRLYSDSSNATETYAYNPESEMYIKAWGRDEAATLGTLILRSFEGDTDHYPIPASNLSRDGRWHKAHISLRQINIRPNSWTEALFFLPRSDGSIVKSSKLFVVDTNNPTARIITPEDKGTANGVVTITGEAYDISFKRYEIHVRESRSGDEGWESVYVGNKAVYGGVLCTWNAEKYLGKEVDIRLTVEDILGHRSTTLSRRVKIDGTLVFSVPLTVNLGTVTASTVDTVVNGSIGDGADNDLMVVDARVSKPGWSVTVGFSDFSNGEESIGVKNLTIIPQKPRILGGSESGIVVGGEHTFLDTSDNALVISASTGSGLGKYLQQIFLKLKVPANSSAGDYKAVATFTIQ